MTTPTYNITLVRHGQSQGNLDQVWQGTMPSHLTPDGVEQANNLKPALSRIHFDLVVSSDLTRCVQTAEHAGYEPALNPTWREGDVGEWEGKPYRPMQQQDRDLLQAAMQDHRIPLGRTGESRLAVAGRGIAGLNEIINTLPGGGNALVFTHGGIIVETVGHLLGEHRRRLLEPPSNTSLTELRHQHGQYRLLSYGACYSQFYSPGSIEEWR